MNSSVKIAVLVSGGGTNLQALIDSEKRGELKSGTIALVISNKEGAFALERAKNAGIPGVTVTKAACGSQEAFEAKIKEILAENGIENHEDLDRYRSNATDELAALTSERDALRNKLKRVIRTGDEVAVLEVKKQIAAVSDRMKKLKSTFKICDSVEERALHIQEQLETLYNEQPERKENSDELFRRRGGTSRKDVPKRR